MRHPRLKPDYRDTWHHCYNRVVGTSDDRPFGDAEKEQFVRILHRVADFYAVRIVAYQVMSNHFHMLLQSPADPPSPEDDGFTTKRPGSSTVATTARTPGRRAVANMSVRTTFRPPYTARRSGRQK
jgi:hypothetical protein